MFPILFYRYKMPYFYQQVLLYHQGQIYSKKILQLYSIQTSRNNSFYKCNFSSELEEAVNKQIESEKQAALVYLDMAVKFLHPSVSYIGTGGLFMKMYEEELTHMNRFINYQLIRGGTPIITGVKSDDNITLLNLFNKSLEMEKIITKQLECLVNIAETSHDHHCAEFVASKFLGEQHSAINELAQYISILNRLGDNNHALYNFDLQLAKSNPYSLK